jgi:diamine N-acetyltransferase
VTLQDVGADNWRACAGVGVEESQRQFVAPVAYYLALCAYRQSPCHPLAVRAGDEIVVPGFWRCRPLCPNASATRAWPSLRH